MGRVRRARMGAGEEAEVWKRWKRGESCVAIGRALDRDQGPSTLWWPDGAGLPRRRGRDPAWRCVCRSARRSPAGWHAASRCGRSAGGLDRAAVDRQSGGTAAWWAAGLSGGGADVRAWGGPAAEALPAGRLAGAAVGSGDEARAEVVPAADCGVAHRHLSGRSRAARVARDDLPECVRAEPGVLKRELITYLRAGRAFGGPGR